MAYLFSITKGIKISLKKNKKMQFTEGKNPNDQQTYKSAPLVIKKLQNKRVTRYHFTFIR